MVYEMSLNTLGSSTRRRIARTLSVEKPSELGVLVALSYLPCLVRLHHTAISIELLASHAVCKLTS